VTNFDQVFDPHIIGCKKLSKESTRLKQISTTPPVPTNTDCCIYICVNNSCNSALDRSRVQ